MGRQRPRLRNGTDLQLQSAFQDGNWPVVIRLAEKRARTFNDQYFEIVKTCAESQLDDPVAKFAAASAVRQFVKDGTVVKDVDAIDLLEWATLGLIDEDEFPASLGPLRVRCVKSSPKDKIAVTRCLESCLLHWDLVSAQQIAAIIDRSFPNERSFLFWNIVITHMLAMSPQSPTEKKKLYGTLAQKQIERAAQLAEQARAVAADDGPPPPPGRAVHTEEEILLLYHVVETHGTTADVDKLLASPIFSPMSQFRLGRKELLVRVLAMHRAKGDWHAIFRLCNDCLSDADENDEPTLLASDWLVWRHFLAAATHLKSVEADTQDVVEKLLLRLGRSKNLRPLHRRNLMLAKVSLAFHLGPGEADLTDGHPSSVRMRELINYIDDQKTSSSCFGDVKGFVEKLHASAIRHLGYVHVPRLADTFGDALGTARLRLLSLKLQYLASTCHSSFETVPGERPRSRCTVCNTQFDAALCASCLSRVAHDALTLYKSMSKEFVGTPKVDEEIASGLAMVVAFCHIRLAFNIGRHGYAPPSPPSTQHLIRALFMLEHHLHLSPKHSQISLVLVQLHLFLGSAHRSREIWDELAVKRTIVDSLAPIFYDRLSTISPTVISPLDDWGWHLTDTVKSHYSVSLKLRMPRRLIDAFEAGSYASIIDMPTYMEDLRWSCTRAMSLVEESRAGRLVGQPDGELLQDARYLDMAGGRELKAVIDYGSFASWDYGCDSPTHARLQIGPAPSNTRLQLSLLSEAFHDILDSKPAPANKSSGSATGADDAFVLEMMARLGHSFPKLLSDVSSVCTTAEVLYFEVVSLLCTLLPLGSGIPRTSALPAVFGQLIDSVRTGLESLQAAAAMNRGDSVEASVLTLGSMHDIAMLRDAAFAIVLASRWTLDLNEREKERDRSGGSNLHKEVVSQLKSLQTAAKTALTGGKGAVDGLKNGVVSSAGFASALKTWTFEDDGDLRDLIEEGTVVELVRSWRLNITGWQQVAWE
ncbi:hypothetical protein RJ55_06349 [Drechmeria coniospora]|nr:hypothetical protein RJ55_06349 [Drechmeria coniospora]